MNLPTYFFVYGTLKRGYGNNRLLGASEFIGRATSFRPLYKMANVGYPYLFKEGEHFVSGEVYKVTSNRVCESLDYLEGYPRHYTREVHPFVLDDDKFTLVEAWVYLNPNPDEHSSYPRIVKPDHENTLRWLGRETEHVNVA